MGGGRGRAGRGAGRRGGRGSPTTPSIQSGLPSRAQAPTPVPRALTPPPPLAVPSAQTQVFAFGLAPDAGRKGPVWTINGRPYDHMRVDAKVEPNSIQRWRLVNTSPLTHYIHLHEEAWRTISRNGQPPPAWEAGLQDTWRLDPGDTVEVAAKMTDYLGEFMIHCHMLDHEDHGMMTNFEVVKPGASLAAPAVHHPQGPSGLSLSAITAAARCRQKEIL